jgi:small GTP-binding protein
MNAPTEAAPKKRQGRPLVALVGNPNTGKSTLFNRLTGLRQHIANYPGITVEKKSGLLRAGGIEMDLLDLPGCYSLTAVSNDERVVMDVLGGRRGLQKPDLLVFVLDATNLKRNLLLVSQCAELGIPALIALNQCDAAKRNGIRIDVELLAKRLGVPVVETIATRGNGLAELKQAIVSAIDAPSALPKIHWPDCITHGCGLLRAGFQGAGSSDLTQAEVRYSTAISDYNKALVELRRRTGLDQIATCEPPRLPANKPVVQGATDVPVEPLPLVPACPAAQAQLPPAGNRR